jgi:acyl-CoA dehydrogenase
VRACAELILEPSATRDRLTDSVFIGDGAVARLEAAFRLVVETQPIHDRMKALKIRDWKKAWDQGLLSQADRDRLEAADAAVAEVIAVDDFAPDALRRLAAPPRRRRTLEAAE